MPRKNNSFTGVKTFEYTKLVNRENISFGQEVVLDDFVFVNARRGRVSFGNFVHLGVGSSISSGDGVEVVFEDFTTISHGCRVFAVSDDYVEWGFGNPTIPEKYRNLEKGSVRIGMFSVVGANTTILPGVTIEEGVAIGANCVVSKDLEPWGVYIGNRRVKDRNKKGILKNFKEFIEEKGDKYPEEIEIYKKKLAKLKRPK